MKPEHQTFEARLIQCGETFVVRRDEGKLSLPVIPGFWIGDGFADLCARTSGGGMAEEVKQILLTFARFEKNGTLPNAIYGDDASNRDTSDAPLWFARRMRGDGCPESKKTEAKFYDTTVD